MGDESSKINLTKWFAFCHYGTSLAFKEIKKYKRNTIKNIIYYPVITDKTILEDIVNRISWYFPESEFSDVNIYIPVDQTFLDLNLDSLIHPSFQERYNNNSNNIRLINHKSLNLNAADAILVWDKQYLLKFEILSNQFKVYIVDPNYYFTVEADTYRRMYFRTLDDKKRQAISDLTKNNFKK